MGGRLSCSSTGVRPLLGRRFRLGRVPPFRPSHVLAPPRVLAPPVGQPRPEVRQGALRAGEAVFDAAPLERIRWADAVDGHPSVGQLDPTVPRRHLVGQWPQVRFQHDPLMSERRHPVPRQTAVRAARSPAAEPTRSPLRSPHTTRVGTLTPSAQGTRRTGRVGRAGPEEAGVGPGGASGNRCPGDHGRDLLLRAGGGGRGAWRGWLRLSSSCTTGPRSAVPARPAPTQQPIRSLPLSSSACAAGPCSTTCARAPLPDNPCASGPCPATRAVRPLFSPPRATGPRAATRTAGLCPAIPARPDPAQQLMRGQPTPRTPCTPDPCPATRAQSTSVQPAPRARPSRSNPCAADLFPSTRV